MYFTTTTPLTSGKACHRLAATLAGLLSCSWRLLGRGRQHGEVVFMVAMRKGGALFERSWQDYVPTSMRSSKARKVLRIVPNAPPRLACTPYHLSTARRHHSGAIGVTPRLPKQI